MAGIDRIHAMTPAAIITLAALSSAALTVARCVAWMVQ